MSVAVHRIELGPRENVTGLCDVILGVHDALAIPLPSVGVNVPGKPGSSGDGSTTDGTPVYGLMLTLLGHTTSGGVESVLLTVNEHVALFPAPSVAVQATVVMPSGNGYPDAYVQLIKGDAVRSSVAVTLYIMRDVGTPVVGLVKKLPGHVMFGTRESIVMVN